MRFGAYPGGVLGGPFDPPGETVRLLDELAGGRPFLVRTYVPFTDTTVLGSPHPTTTPSAGLTGNGRMLDLVAQYQSRSGDVDGYCRFLCDLVDQYGAVTRCLQVTEEPNFVGDPSLDGDYPGVLDALREGVSAARAHAARSGLTLEVGFNTTVLFGPSADFLSRLGRVDVDYVGLDLFPDVFVPAPDLPVAALLTHHRTLLSEAGYANVPLHITEHGWPTDGDRSWDRQAEVVDTVVRAAVAAGVHTYTHFALRDVAPSLPGPFHEYGLVAWDHTPKPAFEVLRTLVSEFG
ncbi:hypothetical protein [Actinosynnema sp. NPDC020468]|uniref:hypothetical protein n=1 Tax=Actinosynnema sp. NPDC020468 TaxID=3154488 RepID=UPI0033E68DFA